MDIHGPTFAAFVALGLSPAGLDEAEQKILALDQEFGQAKLIKWLFQSIRGLPHGDKPTVTLSPADELYLEGLLSLIEQVNGYPFTPSSARVHQISTKLDFLYFARNDRHWSPVKLANFFYRSNIIPTKGAAIVASLRNEAINVLEWIGHHRALGFEDFFFYVNDSDDGTVELLEALARSGVCHLILNETHLKKNGEDYFPIQAKALEHAIHLLAPLRAFEWVLFSDADEFLVTKQIVTDPVCGRPLNHLIERLNDQQNELSGVIFNWKWFGSKAAYSREEGLHFERFCNFVGSRLVKTFARLTRCIAFPTSHLPRLLHGDHVLDGALEVATNYNIDMPIAYDYGQINHYWNKSSRSSLRSSSGGGATEATTSSLRGGITRTTDVLNACRLNGSIE